MFSTASDIFISFLDGIRKVSTSTVRPEVFCRMWNEWAMPEWVASNTSLREGIELSQKQIDDLSNLRLIYDIDPASWNSKVFKKPPADPGITIINDHLSGNPVASPETYLRSLKVWFKLQYGSDQECGLTGISGWLPARYLHSNREQAIMGSIYRKPKDSRIYYRVIGNYIQMVNDDEITVSTSVPIWMKLDFLRYPNQMSFSNNAFTYTLDLPFYQLTEIVTIAVRLYLERIQAPRWQSFFQEDIAKRVDKM